MTQFEPPIHWNDHEDIAQKLYEKFGDDFTESKICLLYTSPSPRDRTRSRMPSSA